MKMFNSGSYERCQLFATWSKAEEDWGVCELMEQRYHEASTKKKVVNGWRNDSQLMVLYNNDRDLVDKIKEECGK